MTRLTTRTASATAAAASELCACNTMYSPYNSSRYVTMKPFLFYSVFIFFSCLVVSPPPTHFSISFLIFSVFLLYVQAVQPLGGRGLLLLVRIFRRIQDIPVAFLFHLLTFFFIIFLPFFFPIFLVVWVAECFAMFRIFYFLCSSYLLMDG